MAPTPAHQGFCFTHNNYDDGDIDRYRLFPTTFCQFVAWGCEHAPSTNTPHLQGYLWTVRPHTLQQVKRKCPGAAVFVPGSKKGPTYWLRDHGIPRADGTSCGYIFKEDTQGEQHGMPPTEAEHLEQVPKGQGIDSSMNAIKERIDSGESVDNLLVELVHFKSFAKHQRFFEAYQAFVRRRKVFSKPEVVCYYGPTGVNKTRRVFDEHCYADPSSFFVHSPQMGQWFDGYCGHPTVLFEEFRGASLPFSMLLTLLDGYPNIKVQIKGSMVHWSPTKIFLTSSIHPREWYSNLAQNDRIDQLLRRIDRIVHILAPSILGDGPSAPL